MLQTSPQAGLQFHFLQDFCQMKTVLMHSYVDEHEHVTGKRFWEEIKNKISELHFTKFLYG